MSAYSSDESTGTELFFDRIKIRGRVRDRPPPGPRHVHFQKEPSVAGLGQPRKWDKYARTQPVPTSVPVEPPGPPRPRKSGLTAPEDEKASSIRSHIRVRSRPSEPSETHPGDTLVDPDDPSEYQFESAASERRVDIVCDPSRAAKDVTVRLELEIEEDWEFDLETFSRLSRLGRFKEAKEHFRSRLQHASTHLYLWIQYAQMLACSGDYKAFRSLPLPPELFFPEPEPSSPPVMFPLEPEETPLRKKRRRLRWNYELLDILLEHPEFRRSWYPEPMVSDILVDIGQETTIGSTEVQCLALCLWVIRYLLACDGGDLVKEEARVFGWKRLYRTLVREQCVWDFRDLVVAAASLFGVREMLLSFFGTDYPPMAMDIIARDWGRSSYDESSVMALLDLYTSLILQDPHRTVLNLLLAEHAGVLAESVEREAPELMMSGPFVRWLLAKSVLEPAGRLLDPAEVPLGDFKGILLPWAGLRLPIWIPSPHANKPDWDRFRTNSTPKQRRIAEVAAGAAHLTGDYQLQAESLKLLILRSQDPKQWMDALAHLQLETQGDREGYLSTCLSRYLVTTEPPEEAELLKKLEGLEEGSNTLELERVRDCTLKWAWGVVRVLLAGQGVGGGSAREDGDVGDGSFAAQLAKKEITLSGRGLQRVIVEFTERELGVRLGTFGSHSFAPPHGDNGVTGNGQGARVSTEFRGSASTLVASGEPQTNREGRATSMAGTTSSRSKRGFERRRPPSPPNSGYYMGIARPEREGTTRDRSPSEGESTSVQPWQITRNGHPGRPGGRDAGGSSVRAERRERSRERVHGWLGRLDTEKVDEKKGRDASGEKEEQSIPGGEPPAAARETPGSDLQKDLNENDHQRPTREQSKFSAGEAGFEQNQHKGKEKHD